MRQYELTYLISDNVPEADLNKVTGKVGGYVKDCGGELLKEEIWGRRKLAYPIGKLEFATYVTLNFNLPSDKAKEFEHNIVMTGKIVRHLIIVKDFGTEELTLTSEDIAETEEIKEVIGGEKSFEVVEGETEESKDLMSIRSDKEEPQDQKMIADVTDEQRENQKEAPVAEVKTEEEKTITEKKVVKEEKKTKAAPVKKAKKDENTEADRLSKLDKELDDILGEEI